MSLDDKTWVTYRMADGSLIWGEYAFVEHTEFFDDIYEPIDVIKETWVLQDSKIVTIEPSLNDNEFDEDEYYSDWYELE